jgi:hypothetical protein
VKRESSEKNGKLFIPLFHQRKTETGNNIA